MTFSRSTFASFSDRDRVAIVYATSWRSWAQLYALLIMIMIIGGDRNHPHYDVEITWSESLNCRLWKAMTVQWADVADLALLSRSTFQANWNLTPFELTSDLESTFISWAHSFKSESLLKRYCINKEVQCLFSFGLRFNLGAFLVFCDLVLVLALVRIRVDNQNKHTSIQIYRDIFVYTVSYYQNWDWIEETQYWLVEIIFRALGWAVNIIDGFRINSRCNK